MLQRMRDGAQTMGAKIMVGIIAFVLTVFGFGAFNLFAVGEPVAVTVNGEDITEAVLGVEMERRRRDILRQMGEGADPSLIDESLLRQSTLGLLVDQALLRQTAQDLGLAASANRLNRDILGNPEFQVEGNFDEDRFRAVLASAGFSPSSYQDELANNTLIVQLAGSIGDTGAPTDREVREAASLLTQRRDVAWLAFRTEDFAAEIDVSEDDIAAYHDYHIDRFMTPERLTVEYVRLSLADIADGIEVTEAEVRDAFAAEERDREAAGDARRRRGAHILLEVGDERSEADAIAQLGEVRRELEAGASFEDKARELSEDPGSASNGGDLGLVGRDVFDPAFESALWNLEVDELSEPVVTAFGVHLIQLLEIEETQPPTFEETQERLSEQLRRSRAQTAFDERLRQMDEIAFEEPDTLEGVGVALGLPVERVEEVTRDAATGPFADATLRDAVFEADVLLEGYNSPAIRTGDTAVVARVATRHVPAEIPLDEARDDIRAQLVSERGDDAARSAATAALERTASGEAVADIAGDFGLDWNVRESVTAADPDLPPAVGRAAFELSLASAGERAATNVEIPGDGHAVVTVTRVEPGDFGAMTESERAAMRTQLGAWARERDVSALLASLRVDAGLDAGNVSP
ncbi:MAG: SurA N-terminal domain-containing protein [Gammaproteobacteria bacterium]|nr:SurA N-terminal domain-containing protein [Gammaproteobacteria bacterium]